MADNEAPTQAGIVVAGDDDKSDGLLSYAFPILDDILYNIIHDLCLKTHREEKIARANTAAIIVDQKARATDPNTYEDDEDPANNAIIPHTVETEAAKYINRDVFLKGNPLKTTTEILCPKCYKPRLLHPTDGKGAKKPESGVDYCKKPYFMEKEHFDIYGQIFQQEGPGRGKKKKDMINPLLLQSSKEGTPSGSQDSTPPPAREIISFPSQKCLNCGTHILIRRMNNHMVKCIGGGGRDSSRSALLKIQNGNSTGSQNGTPPGSRNGTPIPATNGNKRSSPNKRSPDDDFESDTPPKKKKLVKKTAATKLKAPKMMKSASQHSTSNLSFESKVPPSDDEEEDNDDDGDGEYGTVVVEPKKKAATTMMKKMRDAAAVNKKKWKVGKPNSRPPPPPVEFPGVAKMKKISKPDEERKSESPESSQTLSSPN